MNHKVVMAVLLFGNFAFGSVVNPSFKDQVSQRLNELNTEITQLQNKEKKLTEDKKPIFEKDLASVKEKFQNVGALVSHLSAKPPKKSQEKIANLIKSIETDIDKIQSGYENKQLGIGGILGM